jgi:hypothetical protein
MKKLILITTLLIGMMGCSERGDLRQQPQDFIEINGKVYKLVSIVPADGEHPIWIMYPKDTTDKVPTVLNYDVQEGKTHRNETVIKID